jgi:hypothetical protein
VKRLNEKHQNLLLDWGAKYVVEDTAKPPKVTFSTSVNNGTSKWENGAKAFWDPSRVASDSESEELQPHRRGKRASTSRAKQSAKRPRSGNKDTGKQAYRPVLSLGSWFTWRYDCSVTLRHNPFSVTQCIYSGL